MIHLEPVSERTFRKVVDMKLSTEQNRYVAPNVVSLAQAWLYYDEARPMAVCDGDEVVGFVMLDWDEGERTLGVWRFMIASELQRRGYGRAAMEAVIALARESGCFDLLHLDYVPGNDAARELYASLGFRENGKVEDGEIIMTLPLTDAPKLGMLTADGEDMEGFAELLDGLGKAGVAIPPLFADRKRLADDVDEGHVTRLTLMGETIGMALGGELLFAGGMERFRDEAARRLAERQE